LSQFIDKKIYLVDNRIYKTELKNKKETNNTKYWLKSADISDIKANAYYGLSTPYSTAMFCGVLGIVKAFIPLGQISLFPDFLADQEYLRIESSAKINLANTISNYAKNKRKETRRRNEWSKV
jgi:hypothetical protein